MGFGSLFGRSPGSGDPNRNPSVPGQSTEGVDDDGSLAPPVPPPLPGAAPASSPPGPATPLQPPEPAPATAPPSQFPPIFPTWSKGAASSQGAVPPAGASATPAPAAVPVFPPIPGQRIPPGPGPSGAVPPPGPAAPVPSGGLPGAAAIFPPRPTLRGATQGPYAPAPPATAPLAPPVPSASPPTAPPLPSSRPVAPPEPPQPKGIGLSTLLRTAVEKGASDLHLSTGIPPTVRVDGFLEPLEFPILSALDCKRLVYSVLSEDQKSKFETNWELDMSLDLEKVGRFRVNVHRQRGAIEAAFRVVNEVIQPIRRLGLPPVVEDLSRRDSGLVLVTGPTGSGKTTTLAAMVDLINSERQCMVITIEDPIEYIHQNKRSIIKQREVTSDTKSFGNALVHVLRQDPDVIVIGEMRDLETISTALTAAETGHLVLATLHTPDATQTIDRIIDVFPPHGQQQVRIQLANALEGIISQQLLPIPGGRGRVVAVEILVATTAIRKIIRTQKTEQIVSTIQTSWEMGMITMDKSLKNLYAQGLITYDDAISKCRFPENFEQI